MLPDVGFRVLKLDSSNMEDVFYTPEDFDAQNIFTTVDNVKSDRTPLDLLFQVLPELNIELSAKIETQEVNGKKVFFVDGKTGADWDSAPEQTGTLLMLQS